MLRRLLAPLALLLLVISGCSGEGASANTSASEMVGSVPENAVFLGSLKLDAVLKDADLRAALSESMKSQDEDKGANIQSFLSGEDYGIDPASIKDIVFFGTDDALPGSDDDDNDAGVLISVKYEKEKVAAALSKNSDSPLMAQPYKEIDVRASADGENAIGFLGEDLIVVGTTKMVHAVIDVRKGEAKALSGSLPAKFQSLGSPMVKLAAVLTPESLSGLGNPALPINTDFLTQISGMSLTLDKSGDTLNFAMKLDYPSNETAKRASDGIAGLISLFKSASTDGNAVKMLEGIKVQNNGNITEMTGKFTSAELKSLNESLPD